MNLRARRSDREGVFAGVKAERAIIDIGSNTVRMVIYGGTLRAPTVVLNEKVTARLGREMSETGALAQDSFDMAIRALKRFALLLEELDVQEVEVVATAAVRDASNGPEFVEKVREIGLPLEVISGEEEARLSAMGVIGAFPGAAGTVADLGGGSLELISVANEKAGEATSLPLGTLRLKDHRGGTARDMRKSLEDALADGGWGEATNAPLYLVGGTWRAMAVYLMEKTANPLTDPHGFEMTPGEAKELAVELRNAFPEMLQAIERISTMRSEIMPDAAVLLHALLKRLKPSRVIVSAWGLREGLLYDRLAKHGRLQDPMLAGIAVFASHRGAPPTLATRIAGWTVDAAPAREHGSERLKLAATTLALASMQIEPNLRLPQAVDWALHKRWINLDGKGRAMIGAAIAANGNHCEPTAAMRELASEEALEEAIRWGLAIRLARRLGARSMRSLQNSRLTAENGRLLLRIAESHRDLYGLSTEKDMQTLAERLGLDWAVEIVPENELRNTLD